jgi:hypothetical protein
MNPNNAMKLADANGGCKEGRSIESGRTGGRFRLIEGGERKGGSQEGGS